MRIFRNCREAIIEIGRELKKVSVVIQGQTMQDKNIADNPDFNTREIQAFSFAIIDTSDKDQMPNLTREWAEAEFLERIGYPEAFGLDSERRQPSNPGLAYLKRKEVWEEFLVDGKFAYSYSERMFWQIDPIIDELQKNPATRQAIIRIHDNFIDLKKLGKDRLPCSLQYHFMIRDNELDIIYTMRSSDFVTHFCNDIYLAIKLQEYIASQINRFTGKFIFFCSSLHIYRKDWKVLTNY